MITFIHFCSSYHHDDHLSFSRDILVLENRRTVAIFIIVTYNYVHIRSSSSHYEYLHMIVERVFELARNFLFFVRRIYYIYPLSLRRHKQINTKQVENTCRLTCVIVRGVETVEVAVAVATEEDTMTDEVGETEETTEETTEKVEVRFGRTIDEEEIDEEEIDEKIEKKTVALLRHVATHDGKILTSP